MGGSGLVVAGTRPICTRPSPICTALATSQCARISERSATPSVGAPIPDVSRPPTEPTTEAGVAAEVEADAAVKLSSVRCTCEAIKAASSSCLSNRGLPSSQPPRRQSAPTPSTHASSASTHTPAASWILTPSPSVALSSPPGRAIVVARDSSSARRVGALSPPKRVFRAARRSVVGGRTRKVTGGT